MSTIDHDKHEPPRNRSGNGIYWVNLAILILLWVGYVAFNRPDWWAIALGIGTGIFLASWAVEMTGNKPPRWMRH